MGVAVALSLSFNSVVVMAHGNATGIVKERMELMKEMKDAMKSVADIFSGKSEYNANTIKDAAQTIERNAGSAMTELFPEGSIHGPSEARPEIWQEWERFEDLSDRLQRYSAALANAADNEAVSPGRSATGMMGTSSMMGNGGMGNMMGADGPSEEHLSQMPADRVFKMVTDTCSSCHTRYRVEE
ncbi:cytochrome c [Marinobacterium sp. AK62]|uniref:Cytochrome c n=2 Tax=Marinobacterium alkalitolerans TaxID=1542925 RepID=A0ABS3ZBB7_9GAMM|nr:cytochrome c [Marinobacterium alkalitolerans]